jgi:TonB family protein
MNKLVLVILLSFSAQMYAQGECLIAYVSDHIVHNTTSDTVYIWVNNKNQKSFSTEGLIRHIIAPNAKVKVSSLEWAEEFREPNCWYVFKNETAGLTNLCDKENWKFEKTSDTEGNFTLTLASSSELACPPVDERYFIGEHTTNSRTIDEEICDFPQVEAKFDGGSEAQVVWINQHLEYPEKAKELGIMGIVYVQFIVEKNGELTGIKILRSPHDLLSDETIRLVKKMPNWIPAELIGQAVRCRYTLPISFRLDN